MKIKYRKLKHKDLIEIKKLTNQVWFNYLNLDNEEFNIYDEAYLYHHLSRSNYHIVATDENDNLIGFMFGKIKHISWIRKFYFERKYNKLLKKILKRDGQEKYDDYVFEFETDDKLIKLANRELKNELELFMVKKESRGTGIGSKLEQMLTDEIKRKGQDFVYLFTDTYSNYHYYEKRNYVRLAEIKEDDKDEYFYIYGKTLNKE